MNSRLPSCAERAVPMKKTGCLLLLLMLLLAGKTTARAEGLKFGASYMTMNNPYFVAMNNTIKEKIEIQGDYLVTLDPALDQQKQLDQIYELIDMGVAAIFLNPVDWRGVTPALAACHAARIPVIVVDAPVYAEEYVTCTIVSDNLSAGQLCGEDMLHRLDGGNVVILEHPTAKSGLDRIQNFEKIIEQHPEFTIVARGNSDGQLDIAMRVMESILQTHDEIDVVMCLNDPTAVGAVAALLAEGALDDGLLIYGIDGSPDGKQLVAKGLLTATVAQFPRSIANTAVDVAYKVLAGEPVEKTMLIPVHLITEENLHEYSLEGWQ